MKKVQLDTIDSREKGVYILLINLERRSDIQIGKLGIIQFDPGHYAYIGSAMRGLKQRILRHMRRKKKLHWHIDYLLEKAYVSNVIVCKSLSNIECSIADEIDKEYKIINGFGSSDCNCHGHLFYSPFTFGDRIMMRLESAGLKPSLISVGG